MVYRRDEFVNEFAKRGYTKGDSAVILNDVLDTLEDILAEGNDIKLRGFGMFEIRERKEREAKSPKDKSPIIIPAYKAVHFTASSILKARLNGESIPENADE